MSEEDQTDVDNTSEFLEDSDELIESELQSAEIADSEQSVIQDSEQSVIQDSELVNSENSFVSEKKTSNVNKVEVIRSTKLPLGRIKNIMKMDPDVSVVNADAVFLVTKATEMFLETIVKETYAYTQHKRKTINKKDLEVIINKVDCLCFLEGAMDF